MFRIEDGREHFYQWDKDRRLIIEDITIREVHFCNRTDDCALRRKVYVEDGQYIVDVPNIKLSVLTGIKPQNISKNLANLEECRLIQRRAGKIITNVNYLFKGNLIDFYHAYKEMYPEDKGYMY